MTRWSTGPNTGRRRTEQLKCLSERTVASPRRHPSPTLTTLPIFLVQFPLLTTQTHTPRYSYTARPESIRKRAYTSTPPSPSTYVQYSPFTHSPNPRLIHSLTRGDSGRTEEDTSGGQSLLLLGARCKCKLNVRWGEHVGVGWVRSGVTASREPVIPANRSGRAKMFYANTCGGRLIVSSHVEMACAYTVLDAGQHPTSLEA